MSEMFNMYRQKKKRAVDPNAPPRPNLMTHEVKIRTAQQTIEDQSRMLQIMQQRLEQLESKLRRQTEYLAALHTVIQQQSRK